MWNSQKAGPLAKVAVVVVVVVVVVLIMKSWLGSAEAYRPFLRQTFETVPPSQFMVTPFPMMINADITAAPTAAPTAVPTVVPTYSPVPVMAQADAPLLAAPSPMNELLRNPLLPSMLPPEATRDPVPEPVTLAPVLTEVSSALPSPTPTMVPTFMPANA